jgi:hypothetical protein
MFLIANQNKNPKVRKEFIMSEPMSELAVKNPPRNGSAEKRNFFLFSFFFAAYIFLFCWIGRYAFPSADDFGHTYNVIANGFWGSQRQLYLSLSGRLSSTFLVFSAFALGMENIYPFLASFTVLLNLAAIFFLIRVILKDEPKWKVFFLSLSFQAVWLALVPSLNEILYWLSGSYYTWTASMAMLCLAMAIRVLRDGERGVLFAALLALVFLNGMMIEMMTLAQTGAAFIFMVYFLRRKQYSSAKLMAFILAAALCGLLETLTAPGNFARQSGARLVTPAGELLQTLGVAGVFGCLTALKFFASPTAWALLLYMPAAAKAIPPFDAKLAARLRVKHILLIVVLVAAGNQAVHGFAAGSPLSARGEGLAAWMMAVVWLFLWIFCYRSEALFAKIEKLKIYPRRNLLLVLCLIFSPNFIALARDMKTAPLYAQEMRERYASTERQKREGKKEIFVPFLRHIPKSIFYRDLTLYPEGNLCNAGYSAYWGVDATIGYPHALAANGGEEFASLKDVIDRLKAAENGGGPEIAFNLGEAYDSIFPNMGGVPKDNALAVRYYLKAARSGYAPAQSRLIRVYAMGAGVPRNYFYALGWLLRFLFNQGM